jgi:hypothetical protein
MLGVVAGCTETDQQKWDEFWKLDNAGGGLGHRAGESDFWTIECVEFKGEGHSAAVDRLAAALKRVAGIDESQVRTTHEADRSRILYGDYTLRYVEATVDKQTQAKGDVVIELSPKIKSDVSMIRSLAIGDKYPFMSARPIAAPTESVGPKEWDLRNARGEYTLHVGVTFNTREMHNYKEAAVEWVKALRDDGHEAYYYHDSDQGKSDICVGTFGADALVDTGGGKKGYSEAVKALRDKSDFKYNLENGMRVNRLGTDEGGKRVNMPNWSFLVKIPRSKGEGLNRSE